jgi:hypothetical protein
MNRRFKKNETGYHKYAVTQLAEWVGGQTEVPFYIDSEIVFVPDVVCGTDLYEVVYTHPVNGRKLGSIQMWSYFNSTDLSVFEVSADWILAQTEKPERIKVMEYYDITMKV